MLAGLFNHAGQLGPEDWPPRPQHAERQLGRNPEREGGVVPNQGYRDMSRRA